MQNFVEPGDNSGEKYVLLFLNDGLGVCSLIQDFKFYFFVTIFVSVLDIEQIDL